MSDPSVSGTGDVGEPVPPPAGASPPLRRRVAALAALALVALFLATVKVTITGGAYGLYLLSRPEGRPLEVKDDLRLGDGPRLLWGVGFEGVREMLASGGETLPRLDLEWDDAEGAGIVTNHLPDGRILQTLFGRYVDDDGRTPRGLFVGGALPQVAATTRQNQSGMALRDGDYWHHVWCTANELLVDGAGRGIPPGAWTFLGSAVLVEAADRVVLQSVHEVAVAGGALRVERYAYFKAGRPFFRLGINLFNLGEQPVTISYAYGDEPWVGEFGSAKGNVGWVPGAIVPVVTGFDPRRYKGGGILDEKSGVANFMSWAEASAPDLAFFGNHIGTPPMSEVGQPLTSNEVFFGLEWRDRVIEPGETLGLRLAIGLAASTPEGQPAIPPEAVNSR